MEGGGERERGREGVRHRAGERVSDIGTEEREMCRLTGTSQDRQHTHTHTQTEDSVFYCESVDLFMVN